MATPSIVSGGVTAANVILNVTGSNANVSTNGTGDVFDGIVMDLNGSETFNAATVNGEAISSGNISFSNGGDVEVVGPEPPAAAYFTLGPLSSPSWDFAGTLRAGNSCARMKFPAAEH